MKCSLILNNARNYLHYLQQFVQQDTNLILDETLWIEFLPVEFNLTLLIMLISFQQHANLCIRDQLCRILYSELFFVEGILIFLHN